MILLSQSFRLNDIHVNASFFLNLTRAQNTAVSMMEVTEDSEPTLSKSDVVLSFTLEVETI